MKVIGITGNSGSGKSTICKIIAERMKVKIIDADKIAKSLDFVGSEYVQKITQIFGDKILNGAGSLNRKKLAELIFSDFYQKKQLDELTFEYVVREILEQLERYKEEDLELILLDVPLLFEAGLEQKCDCVISVIASTEMKLERIQKRDQIKPDIAKGRLLMQKDDKFFYQHSDFVIENNGSMELLKSRLERILEEI